MKVPALYPPNVPIPAGLVSATFVLRPLTTDYTQMDYAAVIESRDQLRIWSGSTWPADDFSLDQNHADLEWHQREHEERSAFTYTVLDVSASACLGCVYIKPNNVAELLPQNYDALTRFWVRPTAIVAGIETELLTALREWLFSDFEFSRRYFHTNSDDVAQRALFAAAGLREVLTASIPDRAGFYTFWA